MFLVLFDRMHYDLKPVQSTYTAWAETKVKAFDNYDTAKLAAQTLKDAGADRNVRLYKVTPMDF